MKTFIIRWRNRSKSLIVTTGLSTYPSINAAQIQVAKWHTTFPQNSYYIEQKN